MLDEATLARRADASFTPAAPSPPPPDPVAAARAVARAAAARAPALDRDGAGLDAEVADLAAGGLLAAPLAPAAGGADLGRGAAGARALCSVLRLIGAGSLPLARLLEGHVNALLLLRRHGSAEQVARFGADARAGRLFGVWNTQAPPGGSPPGLRLVEGAGGPVLDGAKTLASGAGLVTRPLVTARAAGGALLMVIAPLDDPARASVNDWRAQGMRASATGTVDLTGLPAAGAVLGGPEDYHRQPAFSGGAWRFAAAHAGGVEALLDALRAHLTETGRGGDPHQRARLGEAAMAARGARLWAEAAAVMAADEGADPEAVVAHANLARLAVERAGVEAIALVQRSVGLQGFLAGHPVERLSRDLATYLRQPNPDGALTAAAAHVLARPEGAFDLWG